jgi:hypothetical protein
MPYTPTNWVEGVTTLGPTNMNKIETELAYLDARIAPAALAYGTTLPGSPVDGQEAILVNSTTNPTYQWRFRYNASNSTAYKWEFVGGSSAEAAVNAQEATTSTTFVDLTTVGPSLVLPRPGLYSAFLWSRGITDASTGANQVGFKMGAAPVTDNAITYVSTGTTGAYIGHAGHDTVTCVGAGDTLKLQYCTAAGTATFSVRRLSVLPIRVS